MVVIGAVVEVRSFSTFQSAGLNATLVPVVGSEGVPPESKFAEYDGVAPEMLTIAEAKSGIRSRDASAKMGTDRPLTLPPAQIGTRVRCTARAGCYRTGIRTARNDVVGQQPANQRFLNRSAVPTCSGS